MPSNHDDLLHFSIPCDLLPLASVTRVVGEDSNLCLCLHDKALVTVCFVIPYIINIVQGFDRHDFRKLLQKSLFFCPWAENFSLYAVVAHFPINFLLEHILTVDHTVHNVLISRVPRQETNCRDHWSA